MSPKWAPVIFWFIVVGVIGARVVLFPDMAGRVRPSGDTTLLSLSASLGSDRVGRP